MLVTGLSPVVIHGAVVEPAYDKVHRSACLDFGFVRYQLVPVREAWCPKIREPIQRRICRPMPKADGGICQGSSNGLMLMRFRFGNMCFRFYRETQCRRNAGGSSNLQ